MIQRKTLVITDNQQYDDTLFRVRFQSKDGSSFEFTAGQFMSLAVDGFIRRSYSILNPPHQTEFVETIVDTRPAGPGSRFFHSAKPGQEVDALMPLGSFVYIPDMRPAYFIATGTGIVPLFSMLNHALETQPERELNLLYGVRHQHRLVVDKELAALDKQHANLHLEIFISEPDVDWEGPVGRVTASLEKLGSANAQAYICGNGDMIRDVSSKLEEQGFNSADIMYERFY